MNFTSLALYPIFDNPPLIFSAKSPVVVADDPFKIFSIASLITFSSICSILFSVVTSSSVSTFFFLTVIEVVALIVWSALLVIVILALPSFCGQTLPFLIVATDELLDFNSTSLFVAFVGNTR